MRSLAALTVANVRSFVRDRAALFWTILFPVIFIVLFGVIFSGGGSGYTLGIVNEDGSQGAGQALESTFQKITYFKVTDEATETAAKDDMKTGKVDAFLVIPQGYGAALATGGTSGASISLPLFVDESSTTSSSIITQAVTQVEASFEQTLTKVRTVASIEPDGSPGRPAIDRGLLRAEHPGHGPHAAGHLQRHPAGGAA